MSEIFRCIHSDLCLRVIYQTLSSSVLPPYRFRHCTFYSISCLPLIQHFILNYPLFFLCDKFHGHLSLLIRLTCSYHFKIFSSICVIVSYSPPPPWRIRHALGPLYPIYSAPRPTTRFLH